jgi:hypothetical protein
VKAKCRQVIMSCNTENYHKLHTTIVLKYRLPFLWEMKHKNRYFDAFCKLLVKEDWDIYVVRLRSSVNGTRKETKQKVQTN